MIRKKILLLGDFSVGKTSLVRRYVDGSFDDKYLTTIGVKIMKKLINVGGVECELIIWDVEGATPTQKISVGYYKGASGAIIVTDVSRKETQESVEAHKDIFLNENPGAPYVIAYNKCDLLNTIAKERTEESIRSEKDIFLTSAKEDENVEALFVALVEKLLS